jgi:hypothetical protein
MLSSILQKFRTWFDLVWSLYAKVIKETLKQKIEKVSEQKKRERQQLGRARDEPAQGPRPNSSRSQPRPVKKTESVSFIFLSSLSPTDGTRRSALSSPPIPLLFLSVTGNGRRDLLPAVTSHTK